MGEVPLYRFVQESVALPRCASPPAIVALLSGFRISGGGVRLSGLRRCSEALHRMFDQNGS